MNTAIKINTNSAFPPQRMMLDFPQGVDTKPLFVFLKNNGWDKYIVQEPEAPIEIDWDEAFRIAKANTKYNEDGHAVLEIGDEWRDEDIWDQYYEELLAKGEIKEPIV